MKKILLFGIVMLLGILVISIVPLFLGYGNENAELNKFDVIIVLGNPATENCGVGAIMKSRVDKGIELYKNKIAQKIIFTGSSVANSCVEAEVMANYSKTKGILDDNIFVEPYARNTYENAYYSCLLMKDNNFKSAAIVSSKYHIRRAANVFKAYDIEYKMFASEPNESLSFFTKIKWKIRENMILTYHFFFGFPSIK